MSYSNGLVTVGTTPTPICAATGRGGVVIQNNGSAAVFLGGPNVATSGVNTGISIAAGANMFIPSVGNLAAILFGIVATATQPVVFLFASD
jgi:hypothetical protein